MPIPPHALSILTPDPVPRLSLYLLPRRSRRCHSFRSSFVSPPVPRTAVHQHVVDIVSISLSIYLSLVYIVGRQRRPLSLLRCISASIADASSLSSTLLHQRVHRQCIIHHVSSRRLHIGESALQRASVPGTVAPPLSPPTSASPGRIAAARLLRVHRVECASAVVTAAVAPCLPYQSYFGEHLPLSNIG